LTTAIGRGRRIAGQAGGGEDGITGARDLRDNNAAQTAGRERADGFLFNDGVKGQCVASRVLEGAAIQVDSIGVSPATIAAVGRTGKVIDDNRAARVEDDVICVRAGGHVHEGTGDGVFRQGAIHIHTAANGAERGVGAVIGDAPVSISMPAPGKIIVPPL